MAGMAGNICEKSSRSTGSILSGQTKPAENTMGKEVNKINTVTSSGLGSNLEYYLPRQNSVNLGTFTK